MHTTQAVKLTPIHAALTGETGVSRQRRGKHDFVGKPETSGTVRVHGQQSLVSGGTDRECSHTTSDPGRGLATPPQLPRTAPAWRAAACDPTALVLRTDAMASRTPRRLGAGARRHTHEAIHVAKAPSEVAIPPKDNV